MLKYFCILSWQSDFRRGKVGEKKKRKEDEKMKVLEKWVWWRTEMFKSMYKCKLWRLYKYCYEWGWHTYACGSELKIERSNVTSFEWVSPNGSIVQYTKSTDATNSDANSVWNFRFRAVSQINRGSIITNLSRSLIQLISTSTEQCNLKSLRNEADVMGLFIIYLMKLI